MGLFRCLACGATSDVYAAVCGRCWEDKTLVPVARRAGAEIDRAPAVLRANEVLASAWRMTQLHPYGLTIGSRSLVLVSGPPGGGKTTWSLTAADSVSGACVVVSAELGHGPALAALLARCAVKRPDVIIADAALSVDGLVQLAREHDARTIVVDSCQEAWLDGREMRHVIGLLPRLVALVAVAQVNRFGSPAGERALEHEADLHVRVEGMTWSLAKNRFGPCDKSGPVLRERSQLEATVC